MKQLDIAALLVLEGGLVMFLIGALGDSSMLGQLGAAAGQSDSTSRDLRWMGALTMAAGVVVNFLQPHHALADFDSSSAFDSPTATQINICALLLIGSFFLPWAQVLGVSASGYELMKLGSSAVFAALVPITALLVLINNLIGYRNRILITLAGAIPFLALAVGLAKSDGQGFRVLSFGAYFILIISAVMILIANSLVQLAQSKIQERQSNSG